MMSLHKERLLVALTVLVLAIILSVSILHKAHAAGANATVTWSPPTEYTDGSPLPLSDIAYYTVTAGSLSVKVLSPATSAQLTIPAGSVNILVTVTTTATAKVPNSTSDPASPIPYATGIAVKPNPPTAGAAK